MTFSTPCSTDTAFNFLHPPDNDIPYSSKFFRVIINGTEMQGEVTLIVLDGSLRKNTRNPGMGCYLEGHQTVSGRILCSAQARIVASTIQPEVTACL